MKIKVWGARGSVPAPGRETAHYGGNTSCVQVTLDDGTMLVLDAGTGIRNLGMLLGECPDTIHLLLTHLHLDHIQGLMFFAPIFRPDTELKIWGPSAPDGPLRDRIARYVSAPLCPIEIRELPSHLSFTDAPTHEWTIGSATITAASVTHRGPTLGFRISEGESSVTYLPDHEPGLDVDLAELESDWISGWGLAHRTSLLIHDCQYSDEEYPDHLGWGHSSLDHALTFAQRSEAQRLLLFHHDPLHNDDYLDRFAGAAGERWQALGRAASGVELAVEQREFELAAAPALA